VEAQLYLFLTSALHGADWSALSSGYFTRGVKGLVDTRGDLNVFEKR
jgi:hypothetical protein